MNSRNPLPEDVEDAIKELRTLAGTDPGDGLAAVTCGDTIRAHISDLARRLAEAERRSDTWKEQAHKNCRDIELIAKRLKAAEARVRELEAENGRFAGRLESSVSDWRKLYTEERAERVRIEGILLNDVQDERQESDEHIKGLVTVIKTQDKNIGDLKAHIQRIEVDHDDVEARAESAEARVRELEAFKARVMEWARGDCCACSGMTEDKYGQRVLYTEKCYGCVEYSGDDDAVSLWAPAWEVGE